MSNYKEIERIARKIGAIPLNEDFKGNNLSNVSDIYLNEFFDFKMKLTTETISNRICELKKMAYKSSDDGLKLNLADENILQKIQEISLIPSREYRQVNRKRNQSKREIFRNSIRLVFRLTRILIAKRKYFLDRWLVGFEQDNYFDMERIEETKNESLVKLNAYRSVLIEKSLLSLKLNERDQDDLKKILWILKTFKAFEHIIARDMREELAKRVTYEIYENGRVIAREGQQALRIYFVLCGQINVIKKIDLSSGSVFSVVRHLSKGDHTDVKQVEKCLPRDETMISKGITEVLVIHRNDLLFLIKSEGLPISFLNSIPHLAYYSFQNLINKENAMMCEYFSQNQLITNDAEQSQWIYVIKSGHINVIRPISKTVSKSKEAVRNSSLKTSSSDIDNHILDKIINSSVIIQNVVIDRLGEKAVFGLHFIRDERIKKMNKKILNATSRDKLILISDEAEIILINKRAFMKYADVGTLCQIENLTQRFLNEQEAYERLKENEKWMNYCSKVAKTNSK